MNFNLIEIFKGFKTQTKVVLVVWTVLNLFFLGILLFAAKAPIIGSIIFFLIWEVAIWAYYIYRYHYREKHKFGEWIDAIGFAVIAATVIRSLFIELYQIPTPSMEKSLLVGDFLFVNKMAYGTRVSMTPLCFPFAHHTMPVLGTKAYSEAIKFPYYRFPGYSKVKNGDVVIFNWPAEREGRPVDKKENYIKRCVAIPGDTLRVINGTVYINGKMENVPAGRQFFYDVKLNSPYFSNKFLKENDINELYQQNEFNTEYGLVATDVTRDKIKSLNKVVSIDTLLDRKSERDTLFPLNQSHYWTIDNYGPLLIPKKGDRVKLSAENYRIYEALIAIYENDNITVKDNKFYLEGKEITEYEFKMDYYFMMGDNRHNSADSRLWGFVPEDHIVGKAWFVLWSLKPEGSFFKRFRFNRSFMLIR
ncbi:MAG: signal peptidase I [Flavobacteriales bacterium]|nr:signal peptidase I [Flavobacteriales bacterium]